MPVKIDDTGRRSVEAEVAVPGTPEEVWQAIATGPGISAWFVPSQVEERVGGAVVCNFGPGMESLSTITEWEPPHRFVAESRDDMGPDDATVATEWSVAAPSGGTCVVRVVHSWFTSKDDWDEQFEGHTYGWLSFFRVLKSYLTHFRGQPSAAFQVVGTAPEPKEAAWTALTEPLGLAGAEVGRRVSTPAGAPPLAGTVEWAGQPAWPEELLIRLDEPAPGLAHLVPHPMGGQIVFTLRFYLYGNEAAEAVARAEPAWQAWMNERFPLPAEASAAD
jgi:uncharacterized protein YndB with AHSA1/START domain